MTRHWAIVVGINQYQFRQPLSCAQKDAQVLYDWLTTQAGLSASQCLLSTDTSPKFQHRSTYPTAEALKAWVDWLRKEGIESGDNLWVFFSGYGECWQGQDYLLPIDAEDAFSPRTWLSVRSLLSSLKTLPTQNILLLLDMNRSQSARSDDRVGRQTMILAKELGIATICSCQPEQFSHESSSLGQGFFTAALIEGLRIHAGQPWSVLVKFLQRRLPELSEHSDRPRQDPMIMVAPQQLETCNLPGLSGISGQSLAANILMTTSRPKTAPAVPATAIQAPSIIVQAPNIQAAKNMATPEALELGAQERRLPVFSVAQSNLTESAAITLEEVSNSDEIKSFTPSRSRGVQLLPKEELTTRQFLWRVVVLGGLITGVLMLASLLRSWDTQTKNAQNNLPANNQTASSNQSAASSPMPTAPSPDPSPRLDVPQSPPADSAKILEDARAMIRPSSASELQQAIERASQIPPGDGRYAETQRQIDRWCRDMADIANQRAKRNRFQAAIGAAQLIPKSNCPQVSTEAEKSIEQWRKRLR